MPIPIRVPGLGRPPIIEVVSGDIALLGPFEAWNAVADAAYNLTGATEILAKLFATSGGLPTGAALITDNLAGDVDVVSAAAGTFTVAYALADTAALAGDYWLDFKITDSGGNFLHGSGCIIRFLVDTITT